MSLPGLGAVGALPALNDFWVEKPWADVGGTEAGCVPGHPQLPCSSGRCSEAPTQYQPTPSGVVVGVAQCPWSGHPSVMPLGWSERTVGF